MNKGLRLANIFMLSALVTVGAPEAFSGSQNFTSGRASDEKKGTNNQQVVELVVHEHDSNIINTVPFMLGIVRRNLNKGGISGILDIIDTAAYNLGCTPYTSGDLNRGLKDCCGLVPFKFLEQARDRLCPYVKGDDQFTSEEFLRATLAWGRDLKSDKEDIDVKDSNNQALIKKSADILKRYNIDDPDGAAAVDLARFAITAFREIIPQDMRKDNPPKYVRLKP